MSFISKQILDQSLGIYTSNQRLLVSAEDNYPIFNGDFFIGPTYYTNTSLKHATDIEIQLCLNQLLYVGVYNLITSKINPFNELDFEQLQEEGMLILESKKRFKRPISTDKIIKGEINLNKIKNFKGTLFVSCNFQFENRSASGSLELAILRH